MIIDTFSGLPDRRIVGNWLDTFLPYFGYLRMFGESFAKLSGTGADPLYEIWRKEGPKKVTEMMLNELAPSFMPLETYVQVLDAMEISHQGVWIHVHNGEMSNQPAVQCLKEAKQLCGNRLLALPSFNLTDDLPMRVETLHREIGLHGVVTLAFVDNVYPDDRRWYPLYEKLVELDLALWNHTVNSWSERHPSDFGHPSRVDRIACDFPDLRIIMGHGGWPWVLEAVTCAWRHENVFLEPSAHRWKYLAKPGSGWEPLIHFGRSTIADKVLFASFWQLTGVPLPVALDEARSLPVPESVITKWMSENGKKAYKLDVPSQ